MTTIWERILNWLQPWWCQRPKQEMWWWNNPPTQPWDDPGTIGEQILHWLQPWWCQRPKKAMIWYEHHLKGNFALSAAMILGAFRKPVGVKPWLGHPNISKLNARLCAFLGYWKMRRIGGEMDIIITFQTTPWSCDSVEKWVKYNKNTTKIHSISNTLLCFSETKSYHFSRLFS
jgi:hypothetical protein